MLVSFAWPASPINSRFINIQRQHGISFQLSCLLHTIHINLLFILLKNHLMLKPNAFALLLVASLETSFLSLRQPNKWVASYL